MSRIFGAGWGAVCLLAALLIFASCGGSSALLSAVAATPGIIQPNARQATEPIQLGFTLGKQAMVTVKIRSEADGHEITLRQAEQLPPGEHFVLFNGVVPTEAKAAGPATTAVAQVLPNGTYKLLVHADVGGRTEDGEATFTVTDAQTGLPVLENLQVYPATISPNSDAVDDVTEITYRLAQTCTTSVMLEPQSGPPLTVLAPSRVQAGEQRVVFNGQSLLGVPVADGVYTVTVRAEDRAGNAVEARAPLTVTDAGIPNIAVLSVKMDPPKLMLGGRLHVRMVVQNTGDVPLRTQGPEPGYTYTTNDSYANIEGGRYTDKAGLWRVGLDWDGNAGGAAYRYPFRWGFGGTLAPGATATVDGYVTILKHERTMWFFAGVLQEGVSIFKDGLGRTPIGVSW